MKLPISDYDIHIGDVIWEVLNELVTTRNYSKIAVVVDQNTAADCLPIFEKNTTFKAEIIKISAGEIHKNITTCLSIWEKMMALEFSRSALLINLGGGVIGDMGGFCAGTFKRGLDFIQMPTTLLSQVDASIGGKLGIDFQDVKNSIGLFQNPQAVLINPLFLKPLSQREIRSGFAEMLKHSLIAAGPQWKDLSQIKQLDGVDWASLLLNSLKIKRDIVEQDPFEKGIRKALNFGHTIGHAVESYFLNTENRLLHGEAIAIGMICETYLSHLKLNLPKAALEEVTKFVLAIYGKTIIPTEALAHLFAIMRQDKKNIGNTINFTLLTELGVASINQTASREEIINCLDYYNSL